MNTSIYCDRYSSAKHSEVPYLATSVIHNEEEREIVIFAVNRSLDEDMELDAVIEDFGECRLFEHIHIYSDELLAKNSINDEKIRPERVEIKASPILKKHSWNMLRYKY